MKSLFLTLCFLISITVLSIAQTFTFNKIGTDTENMKYSKTVVTFAEDTLYILSDLVEGVMKEPIKYVGLEQGSEVFQDENGIYYLINKKTYMFCIVYGPGKIFYFAR